MLDLKKHKVNSGFDTIAFKDILIPYTDKFIAKLLEIDVKCELIDKLQRTLLIKLSSIAEVTLQKELDEFRNNKNDCYQKFILFVSIEIGNKYPVLNKILNSIVTDFTFFISKIFSNFDKDKFLITKKLNLEKVKEFYIKDIDTSLGDNHNGHSTALVILSNGTKLIYKPRNIDSTISYNLFIQWVNFKLKVDLKTIKCISCDSYGWLEFVPYEEVNFEAELEEYYHKAGILLGIALLLGAKDCHFENIIASGKNPVIIDHETITQPIFSDESMDTWEDKNDIRTFSILESLLIVNKNAGEYLNFSGYGLKGNTKVLDYEIAISNPNTIDSKRYTTIVSKNLTEKNIPYYRDTLVFANNYKDNFIKGFSNVYNLFKASKEELLSFDSPIEFFNNIKVRYVWRPTFIYFKVLKYMRGAQFMTCFKTYHSKLYELMSKAYTKKSTERYKFILDHEINQLLKGNIPLFELDSLDHILKEKKDFKIFKYNCVENIKYRIRSLSSEHRNKQIEHINKWLEISSST